DNKRRGVLVQAIFRSNFVLMGVPIVANIFGDENIAVSTMMIAIIVPMYNILAVFALETFRNGRFALLPIIKDIFKNPMILGAIAGATLLILGVEVPKPVLKPIGQISAATTPVALIILGASFRLGATHEHRRQLLGAVFGRLILVPAVVLSTAAYVFGFTGIEFVTLIAIFASPCAVVSFAMAQQMGGDSELAANCVVFTSGLSCLTIFCWILLFKTLGVF
ncbi:MAG: AEC family transporter, partial [Selenomonadaceae bacterium]|nr:AEC family transporter [Selenomonadaceae bacterium]